MDNNDMTRKPDSQTTADSIQEMEDRGGRKGTIIVFNIPESTAAMSEIRQDEDLKFVKELCDTFEVNLNFSNPIRLGGKGDKDRPFRITATNQEGVISILKVA